MTITTVSPDFAAREIGQFADLLIDAVGSGASVGFMPPLGRDEALQYWGGVLAELRGCTRVLLAAVGDGAIQGSVQLALETRPNGRHRGEACKLFVHRRARRRGLARGLMVEAEAEALRRDISLLVMDTRKGGEAEKLCEALGYVRYGEVPRYARSADGAYHTTVFYYRELGRRADDL